MERNRAVAALLTGVLLFSGGITACDREDEADVREGVEDVRDAGEEVGKEAEDAVDDADSDGKDD